MQKLTAVILASRDIGEYDRIYIMYSREAGLAKVVGRGVRKPAAKLAGHLEPGTLSEVYIARSRGMGQITSAITLESFENSRKDFARLGGILAVFRFFVKNFAEDEPDEKIFDLLVDFLKLANDSNSASGGEILLEAFWWKLFDFLGHRPETMKCAKCGSRFSESGQKFFSVELGGVVCEKCPKENGAAKITATQIKLMRVFLANSLKKILKVKIDEGELEKLGKIRENFKKYNF